MRNNCNSCIPIRYPLFPLMSPPIKALFELPLSKLNLFHMASLCFQSAVIQLPNCRIPKIFALVTLMGATGFEPAKDITKTLAAFISSVKGIWIYVTLQSILRYLGSGSSGPRDITPCDRVARTDSSVSGSRRGISCPFERLER